MVATVVAWMTLMAARGYRDVVLAAVALVQCYATRTQDGLCAVELPRNDGGVPGAGRGLPPVRQ